MRSSELVVAPKFYKQRMALGNAAEYFEHIARDFGDFVQCRGLINCYFVNNPELVKTVLKETHRQFDKQSLAYAQFRKAFGTGLVISEGDLWRRQRRLMQPHFSPSALRSTFDAMAECVKRSTERFEERAKSEATFNMVSEMHALTLDIAGSTLLGQDFAGAQKDVSRWTHTINVFSASMPLPVVSNLWFPTPKNIAFKRTLREFNAFISRVVKSRDEGNSGTGLLNALVNAEDPNTGEKMSEEQLFSEILGVIIGGHETSSAALTWTWYELAMNPDVERKLHEEVDQVLQGEVPTLKHMSQLKYTRMVVDEAMRLHPPFWFDNRNTMHDVEMGGVTVPKGSMVALSRYSLHRHPDYWPEPERFMPERFGEDGNINKYAYVPFGGGPRVCIGINLATMELVLSLAALAQRFRFELMEPKPVEMRALLTMEPKHGRLRVRALPRGAAGAGMRKAG